MVTIRWTHRSLSGTKLSYYIVKLYRSIIVLPTFNMITHLLCQCPKIQKKTKTLNIIFWN